MVTHCSSSILLDQRAGTTVVTAFPDVGSCGSRKEHMCVHITCFLKVTLGSTFHQLQQATKTGSWRAEWAAVLTFYPAQYDRRVGAEQMKHEGSGLALLLLGYFSPPERHLTMVTKENFIVQLVMKGKQICWQQSWDCKMEWDWYFAFDWWIRYSSVGLKPESAGMWKEDEGGRVPL